MEQRLFGTKPEAKREQAVTGMRGQTRANAQPQRRTASLSGLRLLHL